MNENASFEDFQKIDIRAGTIVDVQEFPEARKPSYKLKIDFGKGIGIKNSSAQIKSAYSKEELIGKQVVCAVNLGSKKIGTFVSEVLTTGFDSPEGVVLVTADRKVENGKRLF